MMKRANWALFLSLIFAVVTAASAQTNRYLGIPESTTDAGFPRIGYPSAFIGVTIYLSFDDPASINWFADHYDALYNRLRTGEVRLTYIPLVERGDLAGGRGATRAALCASEQRAFFPFYDALFAGLAANGAPALAGTNLLEIVDGLGIDRGAWDACMLSERPDAIIANAERAAGEVASFTLTPFVVINGDPTLTDAVSMEAIIQAAVETNAQAFEQALEATEEVPPELIVLEPLVGEPIPPPLTLQLPDGWGFAYDVLRLEDIDGIRTIPFAVYQGEVTGGIGTIVLLWGFPQLVSTNPQVSSATEPNIWADALRLLRLAIIEDGCNIGTDLRRAYSIGGLAAVGTEFAAVDCPQLPDTRGWFAGLLHENLNFVFFVFTDPIDAIDSAESELQAILDTVQFRPIEFVPTQAAPEATPTVTP
jgi:protein-disulfide isomerase